MATKPTPKAPIAPTSPSIYDAAMNAPVKQTDAGGNTIVKVADRYFKLVNTTLMVAYVPADFAIPEDSAWTELADDDFNRGSALSMLGKT